jgi:hypothetical protein
VRKPLSFAALIIALSLFAAPLVTHSGGCTYNKWTLPLAGGRESTIPSGSLFYAGDCVMKFDSHVIIEKTSGKAAFELWVRTQANSPFGGHDQWHMQWTEQQFKSPGFDSPNLPFQGGSPSWVHWTGGFDWNPATAPTDGQLTWNACC